MTPTTITERDERAVGNAEPAPAGRWALASLSLSMLLFSLSPNLPVAAAAEVTPIPSLLCKTHVQNDCVPDAYCYMRELAVLRPELKTELLRVNRGSERHVMTLITDSNSQLWVRDEYCRTVMHLEIQEPKPGREELEKVALRAYERETRREYNGRGSYEPSRPVCDSKKDQVKAARHVQELIPGSQSFLAGDVVLTVWRGPKGTAGNFCYHVFLPEKGTVEIEIPQAVPEMVVARTIAKAEGFEYKHTIALAPL